MCIVVSKRFHTPCIAYNVFISLKKFHTARHWRFSELSRQCGHWGAGNGQMWHVFHHKWWDKGSSSKRNQRLCTDRFFEAMDNGIWWDKKTSMGIYGDIS
jgi:hypothetical protein